MINTVYTPALVKAIVEETRLNACPDDNHSLYGVIHEARVILSNPRPESIVPQRIQSIENELAQYKGSYAAANRREELLLFEAERIVRAQDIFELKRVVRLIHDLDGYKTPDALEYKQKLTDLWEMVQDAKSYASGQREFQVPRVKCLLEDLKPYVPRSTEILALYQGLEENRL